MSVVNKFNQKAKEYDSERRALIPCFDDFYGIAIDCIDFKGDNPKVLDLGAGTGILSQFLLEKYPNAEIVLIDLAEEMLKEAEKRFEGNDNISFICDDYITHEFNTKFDIIISSLSIHHLTGTEKKVLIEKYYDLLNDGGNFVNADQVLNPIKVLKIILNQNLMNILVKLVRKLMERLKLGELMINPALWIFSWNV